MFDRLKSLFFGAKEASPAPPDDFWNALEALEPRNTLARLRQLDLNAEQFTLVKGLLTGQISPADQLGVVDWCEAQGVSSTGPNACSRALQMILKSDGINYIFEGKQLHGEIPNLTSNDQMTIIVNYADGGAVIISTLNEFLAWNEISNYSLEVYTPAELRRRMTGKPDFARNSLDRSQPQSVTLEMLADDQKLLEPFRKIDLAEVINRDLGYNLTPEQIEIENEPIDKVGLYSCVAQVDSIKRKKIMFWLVPKIVF